jgi:hypothetical protein
MFWFFSPKILAYLDTQQFMRKLDKIAKNSNLMINNIEP